MGVAGEVGGEQGDGDDDDDDGDAEETYAVPSFVSFSLTTESEEVKKRWHPPFLFWEMT